MGSSFDYGAKQSAGIKPNGLINGSGVGRFHRANAGIDAAAGIIGYAAYANMPALTANVLTNVLSLSGRGVVSFASFASLDTASRTHRVKITLDGIVIFDDTSSTTVSTDAYFSAIGQVMSAPTYYPGAVVIPEHLCFDQSLLIQYASSLSETAKTRAYWRYTPRA